MKNIITVLLVTVALFMSSCKGENIEGTWKVDPTTIDLVLGEGFPKFMKVYVNKALAEANSEDYKNESEKITLNLMPDGTAILSHIDEPEDDIEFTWKQKGKTLNFKGEHEEEKFNINLDILETSKTELKIGFTGESILKQIKETKPDLLKDAAENFGAIDLNKLVKGGSLSIVIKRVK